MYKPHHRIKAEPFHFKKSPFHFKDQGIGFDKFLHQHLQLEFYIIKNKTMYKENTMTVAQVKKNSFPKNCAANTEKKSSFSHARTLTCADLWNIQRNRKSAILRPMYLHSIA